MGGDLCLAFLVVLVQTVTGAYLWQLVRQGRARLVEVLGAGLALGTAIASLTGVLVWQWLPVWGWVCSKSRKRVGRPSDVRFPDNARESERLPRGRAAGLSCPPTSQNCSALQPSLPFPHAL